MPARGGSVIIIVGRPTFEMEGRSFPTSPQINSAFVILFSAALDFALSVADLFISIPKTCFASPANASPIVPVPQNKSNIMSSASASANSKIFPYKISA